MFFTLTNQLYIDIISCLIYGMVFALSIQSDKKSCMASSGHWRYKIQYAYYTLSEWVNEWMSSECRRAPEVCRVRAFTLVYFVCLCFMDLYLDRFVYFCAMYMVMVGGQHWRGSNQAGKATKLIRIVHIICMKNTKIPKMYCISFIYIYIYM